MKSKSWYRRLAVVVCLVTAWSATSGASTKSGDTASSKSPPLALITGSDRGIGFALVQELETRGWRVNSAGGKPTFVTVNNGLWVQPVDATPRLSS
jgi:hypothetical protein